MRKVTISIVKATYKGGYTLELVFNDNTHQTIDFSPFLSGQLNPQVTQYLNRSKFTTYKIEHGDLVWGDYEMCFPVHDLYTGSIIH